jgi:hypothetical protein
MPRSETTHAYKDRRQDGIKEIRRQAQRPPAAPPALEGARRRGMWDYIKKHNLQNPSNKREILADEKLEPIFGKKKVTMFEMNKHLAQHLK